MTADIDTLVTRHHSTAERVARKYARCLPPAVTQDDLFTACWVAVWKAIKRASRLHEFSPDRLDGYCYKAALFEARRVLRRECRRGFRMVERGHCPHVFNEFQSEDDGLALEDTVLAPGEPEIGVSWPSERWRALLSCLTPNMRRVVLGRVFHGKTMAQIGAEIGLHENSARRMWSDAILAIRAAHPGLDPERERGVSR